MSRSRIAVAILVVAALVVRTAGPVRAADPVLGSGSTFAQVALDQWKGDVNREYGLRLDYTASGSSAGLTQFASGVSDFASSDIPFPENQPVSREFGYMPVVAGGTALLYNLPDTSGGKITNLRLSGPTVAKIFFGLIREWNHADIVADNPHLANRLPNLQINLQVRAPGSGTTGVFTDYLSSVAPTEWADFVQRAGVSTQAGGNYTTDWPDSNGSFNCYCARLAGSSDIASAVGANTPGSRGMIGYAEYAYAGKTIPVVALKNNSNNYVLPKAKNVAVALLEARENGDGTQNLEGVFVSDRPDAYPASSYNYMVVPIGDDLPAGKGETLGRFIIYSVTEGQRGAADLKYSPLPPNLVQFALDRVRQINGAPEPPPLGDWGQFYLDLDVEVVEEPPPVDTTPSGGTNAPGDTTPGGTNAPGDTTPGGTNAPGDTTPGAGTPDGTNPGGGTTPGGGTARPGTATTAGGATTTVPCNPPTSTSSLAPSASTTSVATTTVGTTTTVAGATSIVPTTLAPTSTTVPCVPSTVAPGSGSGGATVTSIAADGSVIVVDSPRGGASNMVGLNPALRFGADGELEAADGRKVPKVPVIGIAPLVATAILLVGLLVLPPILVGTGVFKRRRVRG